MLSALIQMDTANTQAASANIRLRWNYRPDSNLFMVYTAGQRFASLWPRTLHNFTRIVSPSSTRTHGDREVKMKGIASPPTILIVLAEKIA
jgi:hypothetical protein